MQGMQDSFFQTASRANPSGHTHVYSRNVFKIIVPRGPYGSIMTFRSITGRVLWDYSTSSVHILRFLQLLISLQNVSKVSL